QRSSSRPAGPRPSSPASPPLTKLASTGSNLFRALPVDGRREENFSRAFQQFRRVLADVQKAAILALIGPADARPPWLFDDMGGQCQVDVDRQVLRFVMAFDPARHVSLQDGCQLASGPTAARSTASLPIGASGLCGSP